jgi:type IV secretory pathway VirB4 component
MTTTNSSPRILKSEHVFIAGSTGSGKSQLAEIYLAGQDFPYVVKLDTKGEYYERVADNKPVWRGLVEDKDYTVIFRLKDLDQVTTKKIIYVPDFEEQEIGFYDSLMKWIYERQNTTLWIDELMSVAENPLRYPRYLKALMTRGRSRNCAVWSLTQRPTEIPSIIMANSTHFFIFNLNLPQDREKLVKVTDQKHFIQKPQKYHFWYYKIGHNNPILATLKIKG